MSRLHLHILGSGSKGNCALIEGPQGLIMVDDGLSRRETLKRMAELGLSVETCTPLLSPMNTATTSRGLRYGASIGMAQSFPAEERSRPKKASHIYLSRNSTR